MKLFLDPFVLLFLAIVLGQLIGHMEYNHFKLGSSGSLFTGLFMSLVCVKVAGYYGLQPGGVSQKIVSSQLFGVSLIGFIASVGLLASKNIKKVLQENGFNFVILSFVVTFTGAISTYCFGRFIFPEMAASVMGTYVGALTSSPGLATAIEIGSMFGMKGQALIGLGYSIAYIPGVLLVILFVQFQGRRIKVFNQHSSIGDKMEKSIDSETKDFSVAAFTFLILTGILVGMINLNLGPYLGSFSLGKTGGVLITALYLGYKRRFIGMSFVFNPDVLKGIRDLSLNFFLAIVGINYGYQVITLGANVGIALLITGVITGVVSIGVGYFVGSKLLKIERVPLVGGLCGGMTSTPGLASAIEAIDSDEVTVFYGATYPFALLFMILFTNLVANRLI